MACEGLIAADLVDWETQLTLLKSSSSISSHPSPSNIIAAEEIGAKGDSQDDAKEDVANGDNAKRDDAKGDVAKGDDANTSPAEGEQALFAFAASASA